ERGHELLPDEKCGEAPFAVSHGHIHALVPDCWNLTLRLPFVRGTPQPTAEPSGQKGPDNLREERRRVRHSGRLSCFFHGFSSRLLRSFRNPRAILFRVECG